MDMSLSEQQEMLSKIARDFLTKECPKKLVREMEQDERGYPLELWRKMAELGWLGLVLPEKYGGTGGSFLDMAVLLEEMGRACLPGPFFSTVVTGALTILGLGNEELKENLLTRIAQGEAVVTLALAESAGRYEAAYIGTKALVTDQCHIISGTKLFVPDAHVADWIICVARTKENANPENGITLLLVDAKSPGISYTPLKTIAGDRQFEVVFDRVEVPRRNVLGKADMGWQEVVRIIERAAVGKCAEMIGGAQQVLEMAVSYAKQRVQFGRPIGSFQAIQHHCANMLIDVDSARFITYQAAWMLSEGIPCAKEVSTAKVWVGEACHRITAVGHQIHGAIGFTVDHDMQLYYRRVKAGEVMFGDGDFHREVVARQMGL